MACRVARLFGFTFAVLLSACSVGGERPDTGPGGPDAGCETGIHCDGDTVFTCSGGVRTDVQTCTGGLTCAESLGCVACRPGFYVCEGANLSVCRADGSGYDVEQTCGADQVCSAGGRVGMCSSACAAAIVNRSNLGCEYWAVDLDNAESSVGFFGIRDTGYSEQFAVAIANPAEVAVQVTVFANDAPLGAPAAERQVFQGIVNPRGVLEIPLPRREVDGPPSAASNPDIRGSWLSSHAYRIVSNYPIVVYQFNPIVQSYSNDASLLIPTSGLDMHYRVIGWPTANPIEPFGNIDGIPDRSYVTIVGAHDGTTVSVTLGGPIIGDNFGAGITAAAAGDVVTFTLNRYDVLNLESDGAPGDMTGTVVVSSQPVAVFSGGERGIAPYNTDGVPAPPSGAPDDWCCTEHLEEQVFPTSAWGRDFVITRSPQRGTSWPEPDIYRIMADRVPTTVTTNLPGANASFTLAPGEWRELYSQESFILRADAPVSIQQITVSQGWVDNPKPGHGGDPDMLLFPPYQQYRDNYVFLTPTTFSADYVVVSAPVGTEVLLDGRDINGDEFDPLCNYEMAGELEGTIYQAITCPVEDGAHTIDASLPVGIMVYGYYNVGSYGYVGGSDLEQINPLI